MPTSPQSTAELLNQISDPFGVYCVLEVNVGTKKDPKSLFHVFPVMPESLAITQRYLQTVTPTQGGVFVDEFGRAPSPVILEGTFGRSPKTAIWLGQEALAANASALGLNVQQTNSARTALAGVSLPGIGTSMVPIAAGLTTGYKMMKLLSEMVELSHKPLADGSLPIARFYNFAYGKHYEVALNSFDAQMSIGRNGLWVYRLQMTILRDLEARAAALPQTAKDAYRAWVTGGSLPTSPLIGSGSKLQAIFDTLQKVEQATYAVSSMLTGVTAADLIRYAGSALDGALGLRDGTIANFVDISRRLPNILTAVQNIAYQTSRQGLPRTMMEDLRTLEQNVRDIGPTLANLLHTDRTPAPSITSPVTSASKAFTPDTYRVNPAVVSLADTVLYVEEALDAMRSLLEVSGYVDGLVDSVSAVFDTPPTTGSTGASSTYTVKQGDTLSSIARQFYANENEWPKLYQANRTVFSAFNASASELAATDPLDNYIGLRIVIPSATGVSPDSVPYVWDDPRGIRAFGTDLPDSLATVMQDDGTQGLTVLTPPETLLQGLQHRIQTLQGTIPDDPNFGSAIPAMIGQTFGALDNPMNGAKIAEALRNDPRLSSVDRVQATVNQETISIDFQATARNAGELGNINLTVTKQS